MSRGTAPQPGDGLLGAVALERLAEPAFEIRGRAGVEVVVQRLWEGVTRFARSEVHQSVASEDVLVNVRVVTSDGRIGVAAAHTDDHRQVREAAVRALDIASVTPADPEFPGLAGPAQSEGIPVDEETMAAGPSARTAVVREVLAQVPGGHTAAGAFETNGGEVAVVTTEGCRLYTPFSRASLNVVVSGPSSSGYAAAGGRSLAAVDATGAARLAVRKALAAADPTDAAPGDWPVVLEPLAVGALVQYLSYLGFGGREHLEGRSFTSGRLGEPALDPQVTIVDDARSPWTVGLPFDLEGTPKQRVPLVQDGVFAHVVHDRFTAARAGTSSTGHGFLAPNPHGPIATNPLLLPGTGGSTDDLVAGLERGLLVTRFHYVNVVHPLEAVLTGMTRDGTFLVEDGRIRSPVRNLRFSQSVLDALARVDAVGTQQGYAQELFSGGSWYPALRLPRCTFTSATTF